MSTASASADDKVGGKNGRAHGVALLATAIKIRKAGISPHPPKEDGSKAPDPLYRGEDDRSTWLHPPGDPPSMASLKAWYGARRALGIRTGSESGGLEVFEFDCRETYDRFREAAPACGLGDLVERIEAGYSESSPGGGVHWAYFADEIRGNTKLASRPGPPSPETGKPTVKTLIETKGENGFVIVAPSAGPVHPSGRAYTLMRGGWASVATISGEEREALWDLARSFDEIPRPEPDEPRGSTKSGDDERPGDDYNRRATWGDVLKPAGWSKVYTRGDTTCWRRPEKSAGISATTNHAGSGLLYVFTSSTLFDSNKSYSKFGAYALLNHGGSYAEAAKSLRKAGYGSPPREDGTAYVGASKGANGQAASGGGNGQANGKAAGGQGEPDDEPDGDIIDRWPVLGQAAFHGIAGEIVEAAMPHTEADPVAVLIQLLVGFGNAIGRGPYWVAGADKHYTALFAALVGATAAARKGQSWGVARFFLGTLDESWAADRVTQGLTTGEGLIYHVRDRVEKEGEDGKLVLEDEGVKDKRLLSVESELGRALKVMSRDGNTLSAVIRQAWDCEKRLRNLSKTSSNVASNSHVSLIGHITVEELASLLKGTESANGFGNRFLWVCARRSKYLPRGGEFFEQDWEEIIGRLRGVYEVARGVGRMTRDAEAEALWDDVYEGLSEGKPGLLGAMLARAEPQVMRIACIYALLDGLAVVRLPHLKAALAVWEYCEASCRFIFGESLSDPKAEKLLAALKAAPGGMKRSEISIKVFANHLDKAGLAKLLERLLSLGLIHTGKAKAGGGRPAELWFAGRTPRAGR